MSSRTERQRLHRWSSVAVIAIAVLLAPQIASATIGDTIGDPVNAVTGTADDATGQVTGTADDATGLVTGAANDATGQVTGAANDATGQVTGAVQTSAGAVTSGPAGTSSSQGAGSASTDPAGRGPLGGSTSRGDRPASGSRRWAAFDASETSFMPGGGLDTRSDDELTQGDPCEFDQRLVCLGLLYGLGDFADVGGKVIASLAQTGVGVLGLAALALLLAIAGSSAVAASSRRMASVVLPSD
jgi:hypothetical protein